MKKNLRMPNPCLLAVALLLGGSCVAAQPAEKTPAVTLYVATNGNDAWSGALPAPNAAKTDGPFATLERARDAIRALKKAGPLSAGGVCVQVREGQYALAGAVKLTAEDAGTETAPIVYCAYPREKVTITGAWPITGFTPYKGEILKTDVGAQGFKGVYFRQLFLDGKRQVLARYPNFDASNPHGGGFAYVDGEPLSMYQDLPEEELRVIHAKAIDARQWAHPEQGEVVIFPRYNWINMIVPIAAADAQAKTITLAKDIAWGGFKGIRPLDRYYVRNLPEELDAPGEWYLDKETWTLYYWPSRPLQGATVRAPRAETLFELGAKADWITIRGFTLEGCEGTAVSLNGASHCLIGANTVHDTGGRLDGSGGVRVSGGRDCGVVGNDMYEICNYAISLGSDNADRDNLTPTGHYADNNYIHHIGVLNGHGCGIYLSGIGLRASHNLIHDTTRCGIFGGGTDCVVEYNHIRHVNLETEDTGGYYTGASWHVRGLVVRYNYLHDILGYGRTGDRWTSPHFAWGIYLDDDLSGAHVYGNIVARTTLGGSHIHAGRDNLLENNIFVEGANQQMQYSGHDPESWVVKMHLDEFRKAMAKPAYAQRYPELAAADQSTIYLMAGNKFRRNILYYKNTSAKTYQYSRNDAPETNESDFNLIWHFGLPLDASLPGVPLAQQWEEWQKRGFDTHSVVADPLFVDAAKDDYRLKPNSPALKLGFEPIPIGQIGPYRDPLRATWPIVEAPGVREVPLVETRVQLPAKTVRTQPQLTAPTMAAPTIDGVAAAGEWPSWQTVKQHPDGSAIKTAPCRLSVGHDAQNLYVAVSVPLAKMEAMKLGERWNESDAAEVCFQDLSGAKPGPVFVIHGFATSKHESVTEAGATPAAAQALGKATTFAARVAGGQWTGEWQIPLTAAGISYRPGVKLGFNVGIHRSEANEWIQWCGSGSTWTLSQAGVLVLE